MYDPFPLIFLNLGHYLLFRCSLIRTENKRDLLPLTGQANLERLPSTLNVTFLLRGWVINIDDGFNVFFLFHRYKGFVWKRKMLKKCYKLILHCRSPHVIGTEKYKSFSAKWWLNLNWNETEVTWSRNFFANYNQTSEKCSDQMRELS